MLGARQLGVVEKMQIVNRHDLRRLPGRHDERMQRVGDVECAAGHALDGRPAEAMPCEVQHRDRNAPIDRLDRTEIVGRMQSIFEELEKMVISSARLPSDRGKCRERAATT